MIFSAWNKPQIASHHQRPHIEHVKNEHKHVRYGDWSWKIGHTWTFGASLWFGEQRQLSSAMHKRGILHMYRIICQRFSMWSTCHTEILPGLQMACRWCHWFDRWAQVCWWCAVLEVDFAVDCHGTMSILAKSITHAISLLSARYSFYLCMQTWQTDIDARAVGLLKCTHRIMRNT